MSGDGGGIIVGGITMALLFPVVIGAAAVGAAAVGAFQLARLGYNAAKRARERKQLKVEKCSENLSRLYDDLNQQLQEQRKAENALQNAKK